MSSPFDLTGIIAIEAAVRAKHNRRFNPSRKRRTFTVPTGQTMKQARRNFYHQFPKELTRHNPA